MAASATDTLVEVQTTSRLSYVKEIRPLLTSRDPNGIHIFISCLSSIDPKLWAGTTPEIPSVLEEWEVEHVMKLLGCEDKLIRKQVNLSCYEYSIPFRLMLLIRL